MHIFIYTHVTFPITIHTGKPFPLENSDEFETLENT
jgi:hypothetical protein